MSKLEDTAYNYGAEVGTRKPRRIAELEAENDRLREALEEAREDVAYWGGYASDYSKEKHDLDGDLARIDAALAGQSPADKWEEEIQ